MPKKHFTETNLTAIPHGATTWYSHDGDKYAGLRLCVTQTAKTWYVSKSDIEAQKTRAVKLGRYPAFKLDAAWEKAQAEIGKIDRGELNRPAPEPVAALPTFAHQLDAYLAYHAVDRKNGRPPLKAQTAKDYRASVGSRSERAHIRPDERQAVTLQTQLLDDRRPQPPDRVGQRRNAGAGCQLRCCGGPADGLAPLQHDRPQPRTTQVGGRHQAVVATANDDRVVAVRGHRQAALWPRARRTSSAAIRPLAPMIPPPGCVADPHSHRSRTGVRKRA